MRFLLDAQLPLRLARALSSAGHDVVHTSGLSRGNASTDHEVCEVADRQERVVVTKDRDFRDSHLLRRVPRRLLIVTTGNTLSTALLALVEEHGAAVASALEEADFRRARSRLAGAAPTSVSTGAGSRQGIGWRAWGSR